MTKRNDFIYELAGKITKQKMVKKGDSKPYIRLTVTLPNHEKVKKLNVFPDSCQKAVWQAVETNQCLNKDYLFRCKNFMGSYFLIDWKEQLKCWQCHQLTTAGKLCPDCARKILKDYE